MKDIDAQSTAYQLASIALCTVVPRIKAYYPSFGWRENEFMVRDTKWVDLMRHPSTQPYFYGDCLNASNRKNSKAMVFKTKQFGLFVIVPEAQWEQFEAFRDKLEAPSPEPTPSRRVSQQPLHPATPPLSQTRTFSQPDIVPTVLTPSVVSQSTSSSEPPMPLFLSSGWAASTASSSVFERPISEDIIGNKVVYHGLYFSSLTNMKLT